jgi:hypothetical protein
MAGSHTLVYLYTPPPPAAPPGTPLYIYIFRLHFLTCLRHRRSESPDDGTGAAAVMAGRAAAGARRAGRGPRRKPERAPGGPGSPGSPPRARWRCERSVC